ncbi:MAG: hypothetical protein ACRBF0_00110 [Calditrichia bacterium]
MGQQQLLLIVLSVIIVGIAVAVGITTFQSNAIEANRQAVISDLVNYASKAQRFFRTPTQLGGGSQNFQNFGLSPIDTANANGTYAFVSTAPSNATPVVGSIATSGSALTIFIQGSGNETGNDGTNPVKAFARVVADSISTTILN